MPFEGASSGGKCFGSGQRRLSPGSFRKVQKIVKGLAYENSRPSSLPARVATRAGSEEGRQFSQAMKGLKSNETINKAGISGNGDVNVKYRSQTVLQITG